MPIIVIEFNSSWYLKLFYVIPKTLLFSCWFLSYLDLADHTVIIKTSFVWVRFLCVGTILSKILSIWVPEGIRLIVFQISISSGSKMPFFHYLKGLLWRLKHWMKEKHLESSLEHSYVYIWHYHHSHKNSGPQWYCLRGTACIYLCTCIFLDWILSWLLRSRIQHPKTLWNRRRGKIGNESYLVNKEEERRSCRKKITYIYVKPALRRGKWFQHLCNP